MGNDVIRYMVLKYSGGFFFDVIFCYNDGVSLDVMGPGGGALT